MLKRIAAFILAALLIGAFYLLALLSEDETTKQNRDYVVTDAVTLPAIEAVPSDGQAVARLLQAPLPLPARIDQAVAKDTSYHGYPARLVQCVSGPFKIRIVRPAEAAPLIREKGLQFSSVQYSLLGFPLTAASNGTTALFYLSSDHMAMEIACPGAAVEDAARHFTDFSLQTP